MLMFTQEDFNLLLQIRDRLEAMHSNIREMKVILKQEREAGELQQTQNKPENSLGNSVEQVAGQKQEVSLVDFSTENSKMLQPGVRVVSKNSNISIQGQLHCFDKVLSLVIEADTGVKYALNFGNSNHVWKPGVLPTNLELWDWPEKCCSPGKLLELALRFLGTCLQGTTVTFIQPTKEIRYWIMNVGFRLEAFSDFGPKTSMGSEIYEGEDKKQMLLLVTPSLGVQKMQTISIVMELLVGSKTRSCAYADKVEFNKIYLGGSDMSDGSARMDQHLELFIYGLDVDFVKKLCVRSKIVCVRVGRSLGCIREEFGCKFRRESHCIILIFMEMSKEDVPELENMCEWVTIEALAAPFKTKYNVSYHLEDKMELSRGSNSRYGVLVCGSKKKKLVKRDSQMMLLKKAKDAHADCLVVVIKVILSCGVVLEKLIQWTEMEGLHGTGLITKTFSPLFGYIRQQRPKNIMVNGSFGMKLMIRESVDLLKYNTVLEDKGELNCEFGSKLWLGTKAVKEKRTKPGIIESDTKIEEFWSFIENPGSEIQGQQLVSYAHSFMDAWRSFKLKTTQREGRVVYDDLAFIQALLGSKWEQVVLVYSEIQLTHPHYTNSYGRSLLVNWRSLELKFKSVESMCGWVYDKGKKKLRYNYDGKNKEKTSQLKDVVVKRVLALEKLCRLQIFVKRAEIGFEIMVLFDITWFLNALRCLLRSYLILLTMTEDIGKGDISVKFTEEHGETENYWPMSYEELGA